MNVGGLQQEQTSKFLGVNRGHAGHLGECPIRGIADVVVGGVREVVHVDGHLHTSTVVGAVGALFRALNRFLEGSFIHATGEGGEVGTLVEVEHGIHVALDLRQIKLLPVMMEAAKHVIVHEHQRSHDLVVAAQREGLELGYVVLLFKSPLACEPDGHNIGVHEEPVQLKGQPLWRNTVPACGARKRQFKRLLVFRAKLFEARVVELKNRGIAWTLYSSFDLPPHVTRPRIHGCEEGGFVGHRFLGPHARREANEKTAEEESRLSHVRRFSRCTTKSTRCKTSCSFRSCFHLCQRA